MHCAFDVFKLNSDVHKKDKTETYRLNKSGKKSQIEPAAVRMTLLNRIL